MRLSTVPSHATLAYLPIIPTLACCRCYSSWWPHGLSLMVAFKILSRPLTRLSSPTTFTSWTSRLVGHWSSSYLDCCLLPWCACTQYCHCRPSRHEDCTAPLRIAGRPHRFRYDCNKQSMIHYRFGDDEKQVVVSNSAAPIHVLRQSREAKAPCTILAAMDGLKADLSNLSGGAAQVRTSA